MIVDSKVSVAGAMPVTLEEAKAYLKVEGTDEDTLITSLIKAATRLCESYAGLSFTSQTRTVALDYFPYGKGIPLPYGPVAEVDSFEYVDSNGDDETLAVDTGYVIDNTGSVYLLNAYDSWPDGSGAIITYEAGFEVTPDEIKVAVLQCVANLYEMRQGEGDPLNWSVRTLLDAYKVYWNAYL